MEITDHEQAFLKLCSLYVKAEEVMERGRQYRLNDAKDKALRALEKAGTGNPISQEDAVSISYSKGEAAGIKYAKEIVRDIWKVLNASPDYYAEKLRKQKESDGG